MSAIMLGSVGEFASSRRRSGGGTPTVLGKNATGSANLTLANDRLWVSKFTLASPGTLTELHGFFKYNSGTRPNVKIVVYADLSGTPAGGALIVASSAINISGGVSYADYSQTGLSVAIAAGTYWVGHVADNNTGSASNETGTGNLGFKTVAGQYATPPSTFPASPSTGSNVISNWAIVLV